ncbi:T9SS type B sorting domain-containing protein [Psychroserpens sp. NJDZ02]|uniref:T9SS type B sorting domain-containing protein n=1 Tax=Psychroserpens sp. NJDZ02 TaxID=2570561 RepID=UPI0010A89374|nr:T9SS type B sorting domain-containing protein [Psychroserpens sp. NJDZ02]QCE43095.1 T9SS type B sorting domain-containing protein [Psychroserpens sp. NJDZ02]
MKQLILLVAIGLSSFFNTSSISNTVKTTEIQVSDKYVIPSVREGQNYYTAFGGSNGTGCILEYGTIIDYSATIYLYDHTNDLKGNSETVITIDICETDLTTSITTVESSDARYSPYISVELASDSNTYNVSQLVTDVLINNPCEAITDIDWSTGTDYGSVNGIGYFTATPGTFAFESGIILATGDARDAEGPETGDQGESTPFWEGDRDLEDIINTDLDGTPGDDLTTDESVNASYIEFKFVPRGNKISFDFLYASDEFIDSPCRFSDAMAFILTDGVSGAVSNIAVVPGTTDVVSGYTVTNGVWNSPTGVCPAQNPTYFDSFYGASYGGTALGLPASDDPLNYSGFTRPMTAEATVIPNRSYTLKLIIADDHRNGALERTDFDSAVFIDAGSFDLGGDLGDDVTIAAGTAICSGGTIPLDTNLPTLAHIWYLDGGVIPGETSATLDAAVDGVYSVDVIFSPTCTTSDTIVIEFIPTPIIESISNLFVCDDGTGSSNFDLTENETTAIGTQDPLAVTVTFHNSQIDADLDANAITTAANYVGTDAEIIYIRIEDNDTGQCAATDSFTLQYLNPSITTTNDFVICDDVTNDGFEVFDLTSKDTAILGTLDPSIYSVSYYLNLTDANSGTSALPDSYTNTVSPQPIFVRVESIANPTCFVISPTALFDLIVTSKAYADQLDPIIVCDDASNDGVEIFNLSNLETYFLGGQSPSDFTVTFHENLLDSASGLNPIPNPGTYTNTVSPTQTIYVRVINNLYATCVSLSNFDITVSAPPIADDPADVSACDTYSLPALSANNNYYTASGGTGTLMTVGDDITTTTTLYIYTEIGIAPNTCSDENSFVITINTSPVADALLDVEACISYDLPALSAGNAYYTGTGGTGALVPAGTTVSTTTIYFVYIETGTAPNDCSDENSFVVTINSAPTADSPADVQACDTYTLPALSANNNYYTAPGGASGSGTLMMAGDAITTTTTLYTYTEIGIAPDTCSGEDMFTITIDATPVADSSVDIEVCDAYSLPALTADNFYYTDSDGPSGTGVLVAEGTVITVSTTLFIYKETGTTPNNCFNETTFDITINTSPIADAPADAQACDTYVLPALSLDNDYYTATGGPLGTGTLLAAGDNITTTTTLYIYTESGVAPNKCSDENNFTITIDATPVADSSVDIEVCDSYTLPVLTADNFYYTASGGPTGSGALVAEGTAIIVSTSLFIYTETGSIPNNCFDETTFDITINYSPVADAPVDAQACDIYTLPVLSVDNDYYTATGGPNGTGTVIAAGTDITTTTTLYIYTESGIAPNKCSDENEFIITIDETPVADTSLDIIICDSYTLPNLSIGNNYYTASGGPSGGGTLIVDGAAITTSTILYIYVETGTTPNNCFDETSFNITINTSPVADDPADVQVCDTYILPTLSMDNNYYTATGGPNGTGTVVLAGEEIAVSTTLYVYTESGVDPNKCFDENSFEIVVDVSPVVDVLVDVQACDSYILPTLSTGNNYYTATDGPGGTGALIPEGTAITASTILYIYIETGTAPNNCIDESSFDITITNTPVADAPLDVQACDSYILPPLSANNNYYTAIDGPDGVGALVAEGTEITSTRTLYVYSETNTLPNNCFDENSVLITINLSPVANTVDDMILCEIDANQTEIFDLSSNDATVSNGQDDTVVTYYNSLSDAEAGTSVILNPNAYENTSNPETIYVRLENGLSGCYDTTTLDLIVNNSGALVPSSSLTFCDPDSDGFGIFNLSDSEAEITGAAAGVEISYHETLSDAALDVNPFTGAYNNIVVNNQVIHVRVENMNNGCLTVIPLNLIVNPTPQITDPSALEVCDNDADGIASFDLELNNPEILNQLDTDTTNDLATTDYTITYYTTAADAAVPQNGIATPNAFTNTTVYMQTIWVVITDNANGCSTTTTMDLIVNPLPVLVQPTPLELCNATDLPGEVATLAQEEFTLEDANAQILNGQTGITLTHYFTQAGADNATVADQIFSPYTNTANAQTVYVRAEDNVTGCISTITLNLRVNPTPSPEANPSALIECDIDNDGLALFDLDSQTVSILNGEPGVSISYHETESDATEGINLLTSPYTNVVLNNQNVYVRAENDITGCFTIVILPLEVQPSPVVPATIDDYVVCDDNNDGFNQFDFDTVMSPQILGTQNPADFTLTYHTTALNAESGNSPIVNTGNYTNATNPQTIYIRLVSNTNGCVTTGQFEIRVDFPPVLVQPTPLAICDELDANYYENNDDMATFDLTLKDDEITAGDVSWIVAYYVTQADAQADVNVIADPTMYTNMMVGANPANPQTVYVRVTDSNTGCFSFTTLTIRVLPNPTPLENPDNIELCDDVAIVGPNDLIEIFDLTQDATVILNGEGINPSDPRHLSYYTDLDNALMGTTPIADPTMHSNEDPTNPGVAITPQTIYVRVTNGTDETGTSGTGCYTIVSFDIIVNPLPEVSPIEDYIYCELFSDGQYGFDLVSKTDEILGTQSATDFTLTFYAADGTTIGNPSSYTNATNPEIISVDITNNLTGCIARTSFSIEVQEGAQANPDMTPIVYELCDDNMETDGDTTNDSVQFDLVSQNPDVLDGQDPANYIVSYYATQADADASINPLPLLYENIINPQVIYVRVDNDTMIDDGSGTGTTVDTSICYETAELTLQVNPLPEVELEASYILCINTNGTEVVSAPIIETGLNTTDYTFEWFLESVIIPGETGSSLEPTQGGNYTVIVTDVSSSSVTMCPTEATTIVEESEPPTITVDLLTEAFADVHNIFVTATGSGSSIYEFSIDDGPWEVNVPNDGTYTFTDVGAGDHIVTVRDINGCGESSLPVSIMDYPHFFTPNDDGFNDTWNIYGIDDQPDAVIYIFDRYGKLLKQLSPTGLGWDGTYNGNPMPTSDYWFTVDYREPNDPNNSRKQFKAHFTLKR